MVLIDPTRNAIIGVAKPRSWFGPNGQYIRELPCPSCRGRGYTPCTECGIERSRSDCSLCNGKVYILVTFHFTYKFKYGTSACAFCWIVRCRLIYGRFFCWDLLFHYVISKWHSLLAVVIRVLLLKFHDLNCFVCLMHNVRKIFTFLLIKKFFYHWRNFFLISTVTGYKDVSSLLGRLCHMGRVHWWTAMGESSLCVSFSNLLCTFIGLPNDYFLHLHATCCFPPCCFISITIHFISCVHM